MGSLVHEGQRVSTLILRLIAFGSSSRVCSADGRHLIARYRTCNTAEEIIAMQELVQREMHEESLDAKRRKGEYPIPIPLQYH